MRFDANDTPFDRAVDECAFEQARPLEILEGIVVDDEDGLMAAELIGTVVREHAKPASSQEWAKAAALMALAVGVKAERIRQRRHGDHPSEHPPTEGENA